MLFFVPIYFGFPWYIMCFSLSYYDIQFSPDVYYIVPSYLSFWLSVCNDAIFLGGWTYGFLGIIFETNVRWNSKLWCRWSYAIFEGRQYELFCHSEKNSFKSNQTIKCRDSTLANFTPNWMQILQHNLNSTKALGFSQTFLFNKMRSSSLNYSWLKIFMKNQNFKFNLKL